MKLNAEYLEGLAVETGFRPEMLEKVIRFLPTLHADERPMAAELKEGAWRVIAPLTDLDETEREYIDRVHAGELRPELLFPDDELLAKQLGRHPALQWKIDNVKRHRSM